MELDKSLVKEIEKQPSPSVKPDNQLGKCKKLKLKICVIVSV